MKLRHYLKQLRQFLVFDAMDIIKIVSVCVISTVLCRLFDKESREYQVYIRVASAVIVFSFVLIYISPLIETVRTIFEYSASDTDYLKILFKATGICYVSQLASDMCRDSGDSLLSSQAELAGRVGLTVTAMPLFEEVVQIIISFSQI